MSLFNNVLKNFFGNKSDRDIKEIMPFVEDAKEEFSKLQSISNDELRAKTNELKQNITDYISEDNDAIRSLKDKIENEKIHITEREKIYDEIDKIEKNIEDKIEDILDEILPAAFAIVKETAKRFFENETLEVTASDFDRELATIREDININGDKAIFQNSWIAGGNKITWDMVHYDVQLIGGVVLHKGDIAEMATGEGKTLVATLPIFLNALTGRGVHVVTVNDYLAKRDSAL